MRADGQYGVACLLNATRRLLRVLLQSSTLLRLVSPHVQWKGPFSYTNNSEVWTTELENRYVPRHSCNVADAQFCVRRWVG